MKNFTNPVILAEFKRHSKFLIIGSLLIILGIVFLIWGNKVTDEAHKTMPSLHDVIVKENAKENVLTYVDSTNYPYLFAGYDNADAKYYFIQDDNYIYVAYMDQETSNRLSDDSLYTDNKSERLIGISTLVSKDVKEIAVDTYNKIFPDNPITTADYNNYFGAVYLDMTSPDTEVAFMQYFLCFLTFVIGIFYVFFGLISTYRFKKNIKKMTFDDIRAIDTETLSKEAFYYEKMHLYLTSSYIVLMNGTFKVIPYADIIWLYPFEQRVNGIKSSQSIMVVTKDGKTTTVLTVPTITKNRLEIYDEIFNTIAHQNDDMVIGYTDENSKYVREQLKILKNKK